MSSTSPHSVFSCSLNISTDSAQRTFSDASPPISLQTLSIARGQGWYHP